MQTTQQQRRQVTDKLANRYMRFALRAQQLAKETTTGRHKIDFYIDRRSGRAFIIVDDGAPEDLGE